MKCWICKLYKLLSETRSNGGQKLLIVESQENTSSVTLFIQSLIWECFSYATRWTVCFLTQQCNWTLKNFLQTTSFGWHQSVMLGDSEILHPVRRMRHRFWITQLFCIIRRIYCFSHTIFYLFNRISPWFQYLQLIQDLGLASSCASVVTQLHIYTTGLAWHYAWQHFYSKFALK